MNNYAVRFVVGKTYRLKTDPSLPQSLPGIMTVKAEITPLDRWGQRVILADFHISSKPLEGDHFAKRAFVEEGFADGGTSNRLIPCEIANLQGIYPFFAKAYAIDEATQDNSTTQPKGGNK